MTTKEKLSKLNVLRNVVGKPPLKAWKESAAKLDAAIEALLPRYSDGSVIPTDDDGAIASGAPIDEPVIVETAQPFTDDTGRGRIRLEGPNEVVGDIPKVKRTRVSAKAIPETDKGSFVKELRKATKQEDALIEKVADKAAKKQAASTGETVTLVDIARELDINPRVARAKMRRVDMSKLPAGSVVGKHTYTNPVGRNAVIAALKHDFRKK